MDTALEISARFDRTARESADRPGATRSVQGVRSDVLPAISTGRSPRRA
jgi:hypothetical protein